MWTPSRIASSSCALLLLVLASCVGDTPIDPIRDVDLNPTFAASVIDGSTTGSDDFYLLPPLVDNPGITGTFNPNLLPTLRVCELVAGSCLASDTTAFFPEGSASAGSGQYQIQWDTDGPETGSLDSDKFYRVEIAVAGQVMGSIDVDPQDPQGPGQGVPGFYAFRVGETIPVKFWLSTQVLCEGAGYVIECITGSVLDENGGTLALDDEGERLSVYLQEGGLPGPDHPPITVVLERLDPALFLANEFVECLPLFDAPQYGPCFRITTYPELTAELDAPALVSICLDPGSLAGINFTAEQEENLQIVRYATDGSDDIQALPSATGDCPTQTASLVDVPKSGLMRYAAMGLNAVADLVTPDPLLAAKRISLGGLTSSFSRFRFALPGQMTATDGDGTVIQDGGDNDVEVQVQVVDHEGTPVENAWVHFGPADGSVSAVADSTDASGYAYTTWTVDAGTPGTKELTAYAKGLLVTAVPDNSNKYLFETEAIVLTATVVGPPAAIAASPTTPLAGIAGEVAGTVSITVTDAGTNPVAGASVTWSPSGDGSVTGSTTTDGNGSATADWTLSTTAGDNTLDVTVGDQSYTFDATGAAGPAVAPSFSGDGQSADAGSAVDAPLSVTSADSYGNPREGDVVTWTVTSGDGTLSEYSSTTGSDGVASVAWTLGTTAGENTVTAEVEGFTTVFTATGTVGAAVQPAAGDGDGQTGTVAEALAASLSITVTDQYGNAREGDEVEWSGDGSFSAAATTTDTAGAASVTWTLGTTAGTQSATATVGAFTVSFTATAEAGPAATIAVTGDGQTGYIGATLAPVGVTLADTYGNARVGDAVAWSTSSGTVSGDAATDAAGAAAATWTLGAMPGSQTTTVTAGGLSASITATAICFDGYGTATVDGTYDSAEWACAESADFTANLSGGDTPATVHWMNDGANLYMAVRVFQSSFEKANSLLIDFDNDGDGFVAENDDAIGYDADRSSFFDRYVTRKCLNSSQSGCGADDGSEDGDGAAANDGTWTTYEVVHPLNGGDPKDIAVGTGDTLGFFLTLRVGKGAQGNTQWPDFRSFRNLTVAGF